MKTFWLSALVALTAASSAMGQAPASTVTLDISAQPLGDALSAFAQRTGLQVVFYTEVGEGLKAPHIAGTFTTAEALKRLLQNSGLKAEFINEKTVTIRDAREKPRAEVADEMKAVRLAQAEPASSSPPQGSGPVNSRPTASGVPLEEIVVTAQKRAERLQDVPVPVTALSGESLINNNQLRLQDYFRRVPGLSVAPSDFQGTPVLAIRGIATGSSTNPTVGIVVDDVPYGSSTVLGGGAAAPDFDPSDLARVEVLRGPQGTLYGASSIGGLLKFVTVDPSTTELTGRIQGGLSRVSHGSDTGYSARGAVNVPVSDIFAVRVSAFTRRDAGYIDDPSHDRQDVNDMDVSGGRLSALWKVSQEWSLKLSASLQDIDLHGSPEVQQGPGLEGLQQSLLPHTGGYDRKFRTGSATLTGNIGRATFSSLTGYNETTSSESADLSFAYGGLTAGEFGPAIGGAPFITDRNLEKLTQELRLTAPMGAKMDWLLGAFYTHEDAQYRQHVLGADAATGNVVGTYFDASFPTVFSELAAFADLTIHLTERFDVQLGGRESHNEQTSSGVNTGGLAELLYGESPHAFERIDTDADAFTYLVTPQLKISPDLMVYARLASGYRVGGPNINAVEAAVPSGFTPDKTRNYEVGLKGTAHDGLISFDASAYSIDWKDIQLTLFNGANTYVTNAGDAKSKGIEFSFGARPVTGLELAAWFAWNDAKLTSGFPDGSFSQGESGDRLPYSSRYSGSVSLDWDFALADALRGFVGGSVSYVGKREGIFASRFAPPERQVFPQYTQTDLRAGIRHDDWTLSAFATNLTDERTPLGGGIGTANPSAFQYIQPRTVGLSLTRDF